DFENNNYGHKQSENRNCQRTRINPARLLSTGQAGFRFRRERIPSQLCRYQLLPLIGKSCELQTVLFAGREENWIHIFLLAGLVSFRRKLRINAPNDSVKQWSETGLVVC